MKTWITLVGLCLTVLSSSTLAQERSTGQSFSVSKGVTLRSGDSWESRGQLYRLYGVQSCLRGTTGVAKDGTKLDCGDLSLARLGAVLSTGKVSCQPIGRARDNAIFAICALNMSGATVDVGTALISSGYAFSAVFPDGKPVGRNYLVAELTAKASGEGLWAYQFLHPVKMLLNAGRTARQGESQ